MKSDIKEQLVSLDPQIPIWDRVFTVAPLVIIGSQAAEKDDLAPKHMATPLGFGNYFGFVCTPRHRTYHNIKESGLFTVSFPTPEQLVSISLSATPRNESCSKSQNIVPALPTFRSTKSGILMVEGSYLHLECEFYKMVDGFDDYSLVTGKITDVLVHEKYLKTSEIEEGDQLRNHPLLAYIAHGRFALISETYNFPFPKNFQR